jgi:hypothetical protein
VHPDIIKFLHQLMHYFFKESIKIYIQTAPTCFGVIASLREALFELAKVTFVKTVN